MIDPAAFFTAVRVRLFNGVLTQGQVDGINAVLAEWGARGHTDPRWLAYALATTKHETNSTMQPVREAYYLGEPEPAESYRKTLRYYPFYGRGMVQLTWESNYRRMSALVGADLVTDPDKALEPAISAAILIEGMVHGDFTGRKLSDYFNDTVDDPEGARAIVNGSDRAEQIAALYRGFLDALALSKAA